MTRPSQRIEKNTDESLGNIIVDESYCNDGNCAITRRGERHPAHTGTSVKTQELTTDNSLGNPVLGTAYCNDGNCEMTRRGKDIKPTFQAIVIIVIYSMSADTRLTQVLQIRKCTFMRTI